MTEAEWWACSDPEPMLEFLRDRAPARVLRLFAAACCRSVWELLPDERSRKGVEAAERRADGELSEEEWEVADRGARAAFQAAITPACRDANAPRTAGCAAARAALLSLLPGAFEAAGAASYQSANAARRAPGADFLGAFAPARRSQAGLLRELTGNPFRPPAVEPAWLTWQGGTIPKLAASVYENRLLPSGQLDPARLAILADALEDAGCTNGEILDHLRGPGPHVRGCWSVDHLLGKG